MLGKCIATRPSLNEMFKEEKTGTQNFWSNQSTERGAEDMG